MYTRLSSSEAAEESTESTESLESAEFSAESKSLNQIDFSEITIDKLIGSGVYGHVYLGILKNQSCVIKHFSRLSFFGYNEEKRLFAAEVSVLAYFKKYDAPNIVNYYGWTGFPNYCIVMEYVSGGDLMSHLDKNTHFPRFARYNIMLESAQALCFMHANDLLHADIKPSNILLTGDLSHAKLCDFGLTISCKDAEDRQAKYGTPVYSAPELYFPGSYITKRSDMYSFGLTCWSISTKLEPFHWVKTDYELQVCKLVKDPLHLPKKCSPRMAKFFQSCWDTAPNNRPVVEEAIQVLEKARDHKQKHRKKEHGKSEKSKKK